MTVSKTSLKSLTCLPFVIACFSDGIDPRIVFGASVLTMFLYRIVATCKIWQITRKGGDGEVVVEDGKVESVPRRGTWPCWEGYPGARWRVFWQFWDFELFHIAYLSHRIGLKGSSAPQRMLSVLEAALEAAPQVFVDDVFMIFLLISNVPLILTMSAFSESESCQ